MNLSTYILNESDYRDIENKVDMALSDISKISSWLAEEAENLRCTYIHSLDTYDIKCAIDELKECLEDIESLKSEYDQEFYKPELTEEQKNRALGRTL